MRKSVYETNFDRLVKLGVVVNGKSSGYAKSVSDGFMDLVIESTSDELPNDNEGYVLSLAHYYEQSGDLCCDPEMTVAIYPTLKMVEVLTFQQAIPPIYQEVYPEPGKFYPKLKRDLNTFLEQWLENLIDQQHGFNRELSA